MNLKNEKVLVAGGAGFIGSHLVEALIEKGAIVEVADNFSLGKEKNLPDSVACYTIDMSERYSVENIIDRYDLVYNLAVMPLLHSLEYPRTNLQTNINIVINLCEQLKRKKFKKLIHFSSSEVYGSAEYAPMGEDHPLGASTPYAASKAACDLICLSYVKTFGCNISILRPFNAYGERQNAGSYAGVIPLTIERIKNGESPIVHGDGKQTRDYTYVKDIVRAAILIGEKDNLVGEIINIGSGHDVEIGWLVKEIAKWTHLAMGKDIIGREFGIDQEPARPGDVRRHIANVLKAKDLLKFRHRIGMEEGLKKTISWYLKQK